MVLFVASAVHIYMYRKKVICEIIIINAFTYILQSSGLSSVDNVCLLNFDSGCFIV